MLVGEFVDVTCQNRRIDCILLPLPAAVAAIFPAIFPDRYGKAYDRRSAPP